MISISLLMTSCAKGTTRFEAEFLVLFDTVTKIVAYTQSKDEFSEWSQKIYNELNEYHKLFNIYDDYDGINNLKTINDNAGKQPVVVDRKIIDLLKFAKDMHYKTQGKMNIAMGSVLSIWHSYRTSGIEDPENASLPPMEELTAAAVHTNIEDIIIDEKASTVFLVNSDMSLDVGAVGKGYAVEKVSQSIYAQGLTSFLLSVGGNVRAIGYRDNGVEEWSVGIQNPDLESEKQLLYTLPVSNKSLVTSGNYQRSYTVDGKKYHHIIDPQTLMPAEYFAAVTVVCENSGVADCLSTALYNLSYDDGVKLLENFEDAQVLWVFNDGKEMWK